MLLVMQKIISLFKRDYEGTRLVYDEVVEGAEWVQRGEGVATRKWDGTCCMVTDGKLYKRYDAKKGKQPPAGFIPAQAPDATTGHWPGWLLVGEGPEDKWHRAALSKTLDVFDRFVLDDGTYEAVGPHFQGDPEKQGADCLIPHGKALLDAPRTFNELKEWFRGKDIEGIVWWHPDGRMVKIKKKDFGLKRNE